MCGCYPACNRCACAGADVQFVCEVEGAFNVISARCGDRLGREFFTLVGIDFFAQLVDGALGMAFGLISTTALLSL